MDQELEELLQSLTLEELVKLNELLSEDTVKKIVQMVGEENTQWRRI